MNSKRALLWAVLLPFGLTVASPAAMAQRTIVIKFSHVAAANTPKGKAAEMFKKLAEERTNGQVKVDVFPNSELFGDIEEIDALRQGSVQMLAPSLSKLTPLGVREFELFDLPYIFDDYTQLHRVTDGPIGAALLKKLEPKGIIGLAFWDNGFKVMSANKPLLGPGDTKGLKMRVQSSRVLVDEMKAIGALPEVMAFSEVYQAMKRTRVDGAENVPSNMYTQRHHEVQKYTSLTNHGYLGYAVIVDKKFWIGLPTDTRSALEGAMNDATKYANNIAPRENEEGLEAIRKSGKSEVIVLTPPQRAAWKKALLLVHKEHEARIGKDLLNDVYKQIDFKS